MSRRPGDLPEPEEALLGIVRPDPEKEAEQEKVRAENAQLRQLYLTGLMQNPLFREWLMANLMDFQTFGNPIAVTPTGFPDPMATQFHLGMKAAGWKLWAFFDDLCPELASQMRRESTAPRLR